MSAESVKTKRTLQSIVGKRQKLSSISPAATVRFQVIGDSWELRGDMNHNEIPRRGRGVILYKLRHQLTVQKHSRISNIYRIKFSNNHVTAL